MRSLLVNIATVPSQILSFGGVAAISCYIERLIGIEFVFFGVIYRFFGARVPKNALLNVPDSNFSCYL